MDGRPFHLEWRGQIANGSLLGPSLYTSGPSINNNRASLLVRNAAEAKQVVRAQKEAGYDFIKVYTFIPKDAYDAIIETAKELGIPVVGHQPERLGLPYALKSGQISQEHLLGYYGFIEDPRAVVANLRRGEWSFRYIYGAINIDKSKIPVAAALTREAGVWNCPTLVAMDRWIPADEARLLLAQPQMRFVSPQVRAKWSTDRFMSDSSPEIRKQGREVRRLLVKGLRDGGARLLCGTDAGTDNVEPGFSIHAELLALTEAGLTPYEAIRTATFNAAEFLKAQDQFGTVTVGKRADLILLKDNPLVSVTNVRRNVGVMVRGRWFTHAELQQMLVKIAAGFKK
jgi:imidazolonepropionase-like amidohydrolase